MFSLERNNLCPQNNVRSIRGQPLGFDELDLPMECLKCKFMGYLAAENTAIIEVHEIETVIEPLDVTNNADDGEKVTIYFNDQVARLAVHERWQKVGTSVTTQIAKFTYFCQND